MNGVKRKSEVMGLYAVTVEDAQILGRVCNLVLGEGGRRVTGLCVQRLRGTRSFALPFEAVQIWGTHCVLVQNAAAQKAGDCPLNHARVLDGEGNERGIVHDYGFCMANGRVRELEVSCGLWEDLRSGRLRTSAYTWMELGEEWVVCLTD